MGTTTNATNKLICSVQEKWDIFLKVIQNLDVFPVKTHKNTSWLILVIYQNDIMFYHGPWPLGTICKFIGLSCYGDMLEKVVATFNTLLVVEKSRFVTVTHVVTVVHASRSGWCLDPFCVWKSCNNIAIAVEVQHATINPCPSHCLVHGHHNMRSQSWIKAHSSSASNIRKTIVHSLSFTQPLHSECHYRNIPPF
jgi:hypothetical protein